MVWNQLKHHTWHLNIYTSQPGKVIDLLRNVCDQKTTKGHWENYVGHVIKQEKKFWEVDHIIDNEIEPLVIQLSDNNDSDGSEEGYFSSYFEETRKTKTSFFRATLF